VVKKQNKKKTFSLTIFQKSRISWQGKNSVKVFAKLSLFTFHSPSFSYEQCGKCYYNYYFFTLKQLLFWATVPSLKGVMG